MCEADESPALVVGGGSPADPDPDAGMRGRARDRGQPPAGAEAADGEPGFDASGSPSDDLVGAVVDFVELFVDPSSVPDDDTA